MKGRATYELLSTHTKRRDTMLVQFAAKKMSDMIQRAGSETELRAMSYNSAEWSANTIEDVQNHLEQSTTWIDDRLREGWGQGSSERRFAHASEDARRLRIERRLESLARATGLPQWRGPHRLGARHVAHRVVRQSRMRARGPRWRERGCEVVSELGRLGDGRGVGDRLGRWSEFVQCHFSQAQKRGVPA